MGHGFSPNTVVCASMAGEATLGELGACSGHCGRYELLLARQNSWFVVYYSYDSGGKQLSGQWRKWLLFWFSSQEEQIVKMVNRFPRGTAIAIRVDPENPNGSVAEP